MADIVFGSGISIGTGISITPPPFTVPNAPTIGTATATGSTTSTITFTAPAFDGNSTITSYTATSSPGGITGTLSQAGSGTITVSGLTPSTSYTFTVTATNSIGTSDPSSASNSTTTTAPQDSYFMYNSLLLPGNGTNNAQNNTFLDSSTNNFAITRVGNTTQGTLSPYGDNWSLYTNGTNSYAYLPYNAARSIGTSDFSIECWINVVNQPSNYTRIWSHQSNYGLAGSIGVELSFGTVDSLIQILIDGNSTTYYSATYVPSGTLPWKNKWCHVVGTRQSGTLRIFVDGILREATAGATTNINGTSTTSFGTNSQLGGDLTQTYISNFRMCIGSVPTSYQTSSTTAGTTVFTPPTAPVTTSSQGASGVQLLTLQNNRFIDNSVNNFAITAVNSPSIQRFSPFEPSAAYSSSTIGGSAYFDGGTNRLTTTTSSAFNLTGTNLTLECWVYMTASPSVTNRLITIGPNNVSSSLYLGISTSRVVTVSVPTGAGIGVDSGATVVPLNTWTHLAFSLSGSTGTLYINGIQVGQVASGFTITSSNSNYFYVGYDTTGTVDGKFTGYVSNCRLLVGTALYTSAFTPPTSPVTAVSNTQILLDYTNAGIIDNAMMTDLETVGNAQISTTQSKFGGSSMYFSGSAGSNPTTRVRGYGNVYNLNKADFTVEMWYYPTAYNTTGYPVLYTSYETWVSGSGYNGLVALLAGNTNYAVGSKNKIYLSLGDNYWYGTTTVPSLNTWTHIALVRNGNRFMIFINGTMEVDTTQAAGTMTSNQLAVVGGGTDATGLNCITGYIDDFRLTLGVARYTSNFTAPTQAFPTY
jgi:hypothetical protein